MAARRNAFVRQDGQVLAPARPDLQPHAQVQWDARAPDEWEGYSVRAAWREAEDRGQVGRGKYVRFHRESGMLLLAKWGFLTSALPAAWDYESDDSERDGRATHEVGD